MMRQMRPVPSAEQQRLAAALHEHGAKSDLIELRAAFAEKRPPRFKGWDDPDDRYRLPSLDESEGCRRPAFQRVPVCHCEEPKATKQSRAGGISMEARDCRAALAMTASR